jgi:hypothetical protein
MSEFPESAREIFDGDHPGYPGTGIIAVNGWALYEAAQSLMLGAAISDVAEAGRTFGQFSGLSRFASPEIFAYVLETGRYRGRAVSDYALDKIRTILETCGVKPGKAPNTEACKMYEYAYHFVLDRLDHPAYGAWNTDSRFYRRKNAPY